MKFSSICGEATRNLVGGTSRLAAWSLLAAALIAVLAGYAAHQSAAQLRAADAFVRDGGATYVLEAEGAVSGTACRALATHPDVVASSALRDRADGVRARFLPSTPLPAFEAGPGFVDIFGSPGALDSESARRPSGFALSADAALTLGLDSGDHLDVVNSDGTIRTITVDQVYDFPDGSSVPVLGYAAISTVPSSGTFDACWLRVRTAAAHPNSPVLALARTALLGLDAGQSQISQLNGRLGDAAPGPHKTSYAASAGLLLLAFVVGVTVGAGMVHTRRLELASALHSGVRRPDLIQQHLIEAATIMVLGAILAAPVVIYLAFDGVPDPSTALPVLKGIKAATALVAGVLLGAATRAATIRESDLYAYFRER
ncbi:hypothetical protein [Zhihengliuella sp.]|uniref:hypothetical protein n=1 Tax=Zhihengliuella sp. TaxID=1954483 RepID=UPI002811E139|nr:hypothetical protein [Zhihengliuella sp.]